MGNYVKHYKWVCRNCGRVVYKHLQPHEWWHGGCGDDQDEPHDWKNCGPAD